MIAELVAAVAFVLASAALALVLVAPQPSIARSGRLTTPVVCFEDEPCWDCATMGNRRCGR